MIGIKTLAVLLAAYKMHHIKNMILFLSLVIYKHYYICMYIHLYTYKFIIEYTYTFVHVYNIIYI